MQGFGFIFRKILGIDEAVAGPLRGRNQLIQIEMQHQRIFGLRLLNEKHHQKYNDGRTRVNDLLLGFRIMKQRPHDASHNDDTHCANKRGGGAQKLGDNLDQTAKKGVFSG